MTDCRLSISSRGRGWRSDVVRPAKMFSEGDCTRIVYDLDGDDCEFVLRPGRAEQLRRGAASMRISFVPGCRTACVLGEEGLRGGFPVRTLKLHAMVGAKGADVRIEYLSGEDGERVSVRLRALADA